MPPRRLLPLRRREVLEAEEGRCGGGLPLRSSTSSKKNVATAMSEQQNRYRMLLTFRRSHGTTPEIRQPRPHTTVASWVMSYR